MKKHLLFFACFLFINFCQAQFNWENLGGPFGSLQSGIHSYDEYAFIGDRDYLYRSSDGKSWEAIKLAVSNRLVIYHDTLVNYFFDGNPSVGHLQLSRNNGDTWEIKEIPNVLDHHFARIALVSHGLYFYRLDTDELYRSTDLGSSWEIQLHQGIKGFDFFAKSEKLFMKREQFLAQTDSMGQTWNIITPPIHPHEFLLDVESKGSHILVATSLNAIWHSHNNGLTWDKTLIPPAWSSDIIHLVGNTTYIAANNLILQSDDFGISWDTLVEVDSWYSPYQLGHAGETFIVSTEYKSLYHWDTATQTIRPSNEGLTKGYILDLEMTPDRIWTSGNHGVNSYNLMTGEWDEPANIPEPTLLYDFLTVNENGWIAAGSFYGGDFYLSDNNGSTWNKKTFEGHDVLGIWELQLLGNNIFVLSDVLLRSTDKGESWDQLFPQEDLIQTRIVSFGGKHYMAGQELLYSSDDDGITWASVIPPFRIWSLSAYGENLFAVARENEEIVLYMSGDGVNWTHAGDGFPQDFNLSQFDRKDKGQFYRDQNYYYAFNADFNNRTYRSPVDQISWSLMPNEPQDIFIGPHAYILTDNMIYRGGKGLYNTPVENPFITSISESENVDTELFTISPNPASGIINIDFKQAQIETGTLQIFNMDGRLIISKKISTMNNSIQIAHMNAGLYYAVFITSSGRSMKVFAKM